MSSIPPGTTPATVSFDQATTQLEALQRAVYALADVMTVDISVSGGRYVCTLFPRDTRLPSWAWK